MQRSLVRFPSASLAFWLSRLMLVLLLLPAAVLAAPVPGDRIAAFSLSAPGGAVCQWKPGRTAVISFVAFWCDTWKEQSKRLSAAKGALDGLPVDFLTISVDGRWSELRSSKIPGRVLLDTGGKLRKKLAIDGIPYTLVVDAKGIARYVSRGIVRSDAIVAAARNRSDPLPNPPPRRGREPYTPSPLGGRAGERGRATITSPIYLTFDDFPSGTSDDELLDILRANGVKATFFCIGSRLEANRAVIARAAREGHSLQVHSWDHRRSEPRIERCARVIEGIAGVRPTLYRAPGSDGCVRIGGGEVGGPVVNAYDYTRPGEKELVRRVLLASKSGAVVLLHAGVSDTLSVLPQVIGSLRKRAFEFQCLP